MHERDPIILLEPLRRITFGRDPTADLVFSGDPGLSRHAGEIRHAGSGVVIANLSARHSLFVAEAGRRTRLHPVQSGAARVSLFLAAGVFEVTAQNWEASGCRIAIHVAPADPVDVEQVPAQARTETEHSLRLNPATKEFATALVLCSAKLRTGTAASVPTVPELTRQVLEATGSWHLLRRLDDDPATRSRLTGRIHEHLKQLRSKLKARKLAPEGAMAPALLADVLIDNDIIAPTHLGLLEDPDWLAVQAELWWSAPDDG
ncbi:FHA domain-containing protein [Pseudonocardia sp. TRM90224]|uniref:FHA domain-containing protein n=1 Tax=Pseudonocardia sp. TRM90224 TaxID=2812678 RepID=UPI001E4F5EFC|nr:FHA domain-containing protein [Pseudonocardia sp. TRM90224]